MEKRAETGMDTGIPPSRLFSTAILSLILSIAFWIPLISASIIDSKALAEHADASIQSWKESAHSDGTNRDLLLYCDDSHVYTVRWMLYKGLVTQFRAALSLGAQASIYAISGDIVEISIDGNTIIAFDTGRQVLLKDGTGYAYIAAILDLCGIGLLLYRGKVRKCCSKKR